MRYFFTILAILVIIVFSAALAVPYFVNWNDQRTIVAARISDLLGATVKINGPIDLKLLPTPYLALGAVEIADPNGKSTAKVAEIRLEIALAPLLRGDVDFIEAKLVRPQIRFEIEDGTIRLPRPTGVKGAIRFDRISIQNGDIAVADPATGRNYAFEALDLEAEAPSLEGPFKGEGRMGRGADRSVLRFSTAALENDQLRFKFILDEAQSHPRTELEGSLGFDPHSHALPVLDAKMVQTGRLDDTVPVPWRLAGVLHAELRLATLADVDLRLGDEDHSVSLAGAAEFDLGAAPHAHIGLKAKQVNLDRLLNDKNAPPAPQRLEAAVRKWIATVPAPSAPMTLDWAFDSVLIGNESFSDVVGSIGLSNTNVTTLRVGAEGPSQSRLALDGKLETGSAPSFDGQIDAAAGDLTRLRDWVAINLPDLEVARDALPIRSCEIAGKVNVSPVGFFGSRLRLRLDRSTLAGSLAFTRAVGSDPPRLYADLSAEALDLDHLPDMRTAFDDTKPMDLSLRLDSHAIKVADVGQGPVDAGRIVLKLTKAGANTALEKLDIAGLGGMNLHANGNFDGKAGQIEVKLDAGGLADAAALLRRVFPGPAAELLAARAAGLSPAHLTLAAEVQRNDANGFAFSSLDLSGSAAQTNVKAKLAPDPRDSSHIAFSAHLDAPEISSLFRQIGFSALPLKGLGGGQVDLAAQGDIKRPLDAQITATLAGTKLDFNGTLEPDFIAPHAKGALKLSSRDLSGLIEATALAFPDLAGRLPADFTAAVEWKGASLSLHKLEGTLAGTPIKADLTYAGAPEKRLSGSLDLASVSLGDFAALVLGPMQMVKSGQIWSDSAFATGLIDPPTTSLAINAKSFMLWPGVVGANAKMNLDVASDQAGPKISLRLIYMRLGTGGMEADLVLRRDGAAASTEGHVSLQDFTLDLPSVAGTLNAELDVASTGPNGSTLIAGLAGSGNVSFADLYFPHSDPRALVRVFNAVEADQIGIDEGEIARALTREFDKKPLSLHNVEFDAGLAAGILRLTPKADAPIESPAADQKIACDLLATADWRSLTLDQRITLRLGNLPKNWKDAPPQVSLVATGPITHPTRSLEAALFTNALAARAIARESARIELQEFDLHERAVSYQRLRSERRREQERLKAEEDARRAAEDAKRAAEEKHAADDARRATEERQRAVVEEAIRAAEEKKRAAEFAIGTAEPTESEHKSDTPPAPTTGFEWRRSPMPPSRPPSLRAPIQ